MHKKLTVALLGLLATCAGALALALENPAETPNPNDPSVNQVYDAARAGHPDQARQMMNQVLANHPHSARAHYVAAEVDADLKNYGEAREQLKTAEQIDPGLPFANPQSVAALRREIGAPSVGQPEGPRAPMIAPAQSASKPFPWAMAWIIGAVVLVVWLLLRRRQAPPAYSPYPGNMPNAAMGPGSMVPPAGGFPNVVGGAGSGIIGGLASGLAVGAGVAAGEELVRHAFEHGGSAPIPERFEPNEVQAQPDPNADLGGPEFGISDGGGWDDGGGSSSGDDGGGWT